jgi:eukaryotic-like serine/threonine-protein kinase
MNVRQAPADPEVTLRSEREAASGDAGPPDAQARTRASGPAPSSPPGAADTGDGLVSTARGMGPRSRSARQRVPFSRRPSPYAVGEVVADKYELVSMIGRGGMGEVWHARHRELGTDLAIKFLDRERHAAGEADEASSVLARFRFEAQVSARLGARTRHIVAAHDAGTHRDAPYLVMELVRGRTLESVIDELGSVPPERMALILEQVADALAVAHEMGIVHRDIKPANIMLVDPNGSEAISSITGTATLMAKLADFGVAKALRTNLNIDRPNETAEGLLVGSPAYMSPEQLRAEGKLSAASDIWSLGVVTYEALTGWPAFTANSIAELIVAISTRSPDAPSSVRTHIPTSVDAWFHRALAKEPGDRFASAPEAALAFREALRAPAAGERRRGARWRALLAALAAAVIIGAVVMAMRGPSAPVVPPEVATVLAAPSPPPIVADPLPPATATAVAAPPTATAPAPATASVASGKRPPAARPTPRAPAPPAPAPPAPAPATAQPAPSSAPLPPKEYDKSDTQ